MKEAFDRYVGDHCPCFVPREKVTPAQAVELILGAGGVPVLAHPILYHMSDDRLDTRSGIEKDRPRGHRSHLQHLQYRRGTPDPGLASKYDLKISGGSDFHGQQAKDRPRNRLGKLYVPDEVLENLRPEKK